MSPQKATTKNSYAPPNKPRKRPGRHRKTVLKASKGQTFFTEGRCR